jgi:hypothetical protein
MKQLQIIAVTLLLLAIAPAVLQAQLPKKRVLTLNVAKKLSNSPKR